MRFIDYQLLGTVRVSQYKSCPSILSNPSLVKGKAVVEEDDEEEELRKLQAEMAM